MANPAKYNKNELGKRSKKTPPEIKLPFEPKGQQEPGAWVYDHRVALSITVIIYLVLAIFFVFSKIIIDKPDPRTEIIIDFNELDRLQKELEKAQELNRLLNEESMGMQENVRNVVSNENARSDRENLSRTTEEIMRNADKALDETRQTREMYEEGLREEQRLIEERLRGKDENSTGEDAKVEGQVTVKFSLRNPVRHSVNLFIPAYQCEGGGRVVVNITVNQNGEVTAAAVDKARSSSDYCMTTTAVNAAMNSRFNVNMQAPAKHTGTITYTFIAQ